MNDKPDFEKIQMKMRIEELEGQLNKAGSAVQSQMMNIYQTLLNEEFDEAIEMLGQMLGLEGE